jgi:hypothetical protein
MKVIAQPCLDVYGKLKKAATMMDAKPMTMISLHVKTKQAMAVNGWLMGMTMVMDLAIVNLISQDARASLKMYAILPWPHLMGHRMHVPGLMAPVLAL